MDDYQDNNNSKRGFASMDPAKQRKIAAKGGRAAHRSGKAHEWNSREAKKAGKLGGRARSRNTDLGENSDTF